MKINELKGCLQLKEYTTVNGREVTGVYCCDLLSNALINLKNGNLWITIMNNANVTAVAKAKNVSAVILAEGVVPDMDMLAASKEHGICVLGSNLPVYELTVALHLALKEQK